ncbi:hypothetical protein SAMN04489761_1019 [Tenacibaculum sp. MAR_2009_124]|uniref:hypothetical protein n=1 Tax=Tenacibaculum sp. MAR_2009_124 TaxID=1250059 RepID=UPI0008945668|nr:hypothetical protein [Tenacibaculum sp. MAR_2009_124]SEB49181.1 hypothetical protein SAMN04489761_1019 [Tenacibaculum sp. MAR_2009_124]
MINIWTKEEFTTYVLLYVAHCNYIETEEESDYIISKIDEDLYNKIHTEIVMDIDEKVKLNKIKDYLDQNKYNHGEKKELLNDIKNVIFADGTVDNSEKKVFNYLVKILS